MLDRRTQSLTLLISATRQELEQREQAMAALQNTQGQARSQLQTLVNYRLDYRQRLSQAGHIGTSIESYRNFTRFLDALEQAIMQQTGVIAQLQTQIDAEQDKWHTVQQRLHAYDTLRQRLDRQARAIEHRQEQRITDEISALMRQHGGATHG